MFPEPFLFELHRAGVDVDAWLGQVLGHGEPNVVHFALAHLAQSGTKVWTVNFDPLIEKAGGSGFPVVAWPDKANLPGLLRKAHGSLGGPLVATSEQVISGLDPLWLEQLEADLHGRSTAVFLGYSGRDLDFHLHWDNALRQIEKVIWFDVPDPIGREYRSSLLPMAVARGALDMPDPWPLPEWAPSGSPPNPSWDFLCWCSSHGLGDPDPDLLRVLFDAPREQPGTQIPGDLTWVKSSVLGMLGAYGEERKQYVRTLLRSHGQRRRAARALAIHIANHGGSAVGAAMGLARALPDTGRTTPLKELANRKRLTVFNRVGAHEKTIRALGHKGAGEVSTYDILRAQSLRMIGSLDEAVRIADRAYQKALTEQHPVRVAHAAYQKCQALLWSERLDETRTCLYDELKPHAAIAASRWVAWADFIAAGLLIRENRPGESLDTYAASERRFMAEALLDGAVSTQVGRLTALRQLKNDAQFEERLIQVRRLVTNGLPRTGYYATRHNFTVESLRWEEAEFLRTHAADSRGAAHLFSSMLGSKYPLHVAFGHFGLALCDRSPASQASHLRDAGRISTDIGLRLVTSRCREFESGDPRSYREMFFC